MFAPEHKSCANLAKKHTLSSGFTLVELIIVVAIIAIIGTVAIPVYRNYVTAAKGNAAESVLEQFPILLESFRSENGSFPADATYTYTEAANGTVLTDTILDVLPDFKPRNASATGAIMFNYSLTIANSGTANEAATFSATGVREADGIVKNGTYQ